MPEKSHGKLVAGAAIAAVAIVIAGGALAPRFREHQVRLLIASGRTSEAYAAATSSGDEKLLERAIDAHIASLTTEDGLVWLLAEAESAASPILRERTRPLAAKLFHDAFGARDARDGLIDDVAKLRATVRAPVVDAAAAGFLADRFGASSRVLPEPALRWYRDAADAGIALEPRVADLAIASMHEIAPPPAEISLGIEVLERWFPDRIDAFIAKALEAGSGSERLHALIAAKRREHAAASEPVNAALLELHFGESREAVAELADEKDPRRVKEILEICDAVTGAAPESAEPEISQWRDRFRLVRERLVAAK